MPNFFAQEGRVAQRMRPVSRRPEPKNEDASTTAPRSVAERMEFVSLRREAAQPPSVADRMDAAADTRDDTENVAKAMNKVAGRLEEPAAEKKADTAVEPSNAPAKSTKSEPEKAPAAAEKKDAAENPAATAAAPAEPPKTSSAAPAPSAAATPTADYLVPSYTTGEESTPTVGAGATILTFSDDNATDLRTALNTPKEYNIEQVYVSSIRGSSHVPENWDTMTFEKFQEDCINNEVTKLQKLSLRSVLPLKYFNNCKSTICTRKGKNEDAFEACKEISLKSDDKDTATKWLYNEMIEKNGENAKNKGPIDSVEYDTPSENYEWVKVSPYAIITDEGGVLYCDHLLKKKTVSLKQTTHHSKSTLINMLLRGDMADIRAAFNE